MSRRLAALTALACLAVSATAASAAKPRPRPIKPVCFQLTDPSGDAKPLPNGDSYDSIDIVSADVATGPHALVVALRLRSLTAKEPFLGGAKYGVTFTVGKVGQRVGYETYGTGADQWRGEFDPNTDQNSGGDSVPAIAVADPATSTITWTVPRKTDPALKPGVRIGAFAVKAQYALNYKYSTTVDGRSVLPTGGDDATSGATYADGYPSCLKGT